MKKYNVIIIGGGTAGVAAAYALTSSEKKYSVALVEKEAVLGGTAVNALVYDWIQGINPPYFEKICDSLGKVGKCMIYRKVGDSMKLKPYGNPEDIKYTWVTRKFYGDMQGVADVPGDDGHIFFDPDALSVKYKMDLEQFENIDLYIGSQLQRVGTSSNAVTRKESKEILNTVIIRNEKNEELELSADFFIDCSGNGVLCRSVNGIEGEGYHIGLDRYEMYGEELLKPNDLGFDNYKMEALIAPSMFFKIHYNSSSMQFPEKNVKSNVSVDGYAFVYVGRNDIKTCNPINGLGISGNEVIKNLSDEGALRQKFIDKINDYYSLVKKSNVTWAKNYNITADTDYAVVPGIRETYRVECNKMLTLNDLKVNAFDAINKEAGKRFIAVGSHGIDLHNTIGISGDVGKFNSSQLQPYGILYDSIVPKSLDNVWIACRAFGASHLAISSARVNKVMAQLGWAAGNAARYCLDNRRKTTELSDDDVKYLKSIEYTSFEEQIKKAYAALSSSKSE